MATSLSDKNRTAAGLGIITSVLLSPQNPLHTPPMKLTNFFGSSSASSSSSSSSRSRAVDRPPLGPGSSKADYSYGLNPPGPSNAPGLSQSYFGGYDDAPPPYDPKGSPGPHDWATDHKMPEPEKSQTATAHFPTPDLIHRRMDSNGEDPLLALLPYDIVVVLDDSYSMTMADKMANKTYGEIRWNQVSNDPPPPLSTHTHASSLSGVI